MGRSDRGRGSRSCPFDLRAPLVLRYAMPAFDPEKFAASVHKLRQRLGPSERFTREFAGLVFRYFGPPGFRFDQVAFRIMCREPVVRAEMFVLGGGMLTVVVTEGTTE